LTPEQQKFYQQRLGWKVQTVNDVFLASEFLRQQMEPDEPDPEPAKERQK
jgi:hypothetical protein